MLLNRYIFGNETAEDENPAILDAYFVEKDEFIDFYDENFSFRVVRGKKGVGKSALICHAAYVLNNNEDNLVVSLKGSDFAHGGRFSSVTANEFLYEWEQRICTLINIELGKRVGFAASDDTITLVEQSEIAGFKGRNLVGALLDRFSIKLKNISYEKKLFENHRALAERYLNRKKDITVWLFVDDIDATFSRRPEECLKISTFFSACRNMVSSVKNLRIRCSVRDDVWASIFGTDESLDKCVQYISDIMWSLEDMRTLFAYRALACISQTTSKPEKPKSRAQKNKILRLIFPDTYIWRGKPQDSIQVIHNYAAARPRWALQLCRMAVAAELKNGRTPEQISLPMIENIINSYGELRLQQVVAEHIHQCPNIKDLLLTFARKGSLFTTDKLLKTINKAREIIDITLPPNEHPDDMSIAHFLFMIEFISGVEKKPGSTREMIFRYNQKPYLLMSATNYDEGLDWRVHPAYWGALHISGLT